MSALRYDGAFPLDVLADDERVRSAGDGTGAAIVSSPLGEMRVNVGELLIGPPCSVVQLGDRPPFTIQGGEEIR